MIGPGYKLLVVDDLPDWRETLWGLLGDAGYEVQVAGSYGDAISLLETNEFDLAVVDLRLDESNEDDEGGLELAAVIKQRWPSVKIIIITGSGVPEKLRRLLQFDRSKVQNLLDGYLPKTETDNLVPFVQGVLTQ